MHTVWTLHPFLPHPKSMWGETLSHHPGGLPGPGPTLGPLSWRAWGGCRAQGWTRGSPSRVSAMPRK